MVLKKLVVIVVLVVTVGNIVQAKFEGDNCSLNKTGETGQCVIISKCPYAIPELRRRIFPQLCGFTGKEPIVCCPPRTENIVRMARLRSQDKCNEYTNYIFRGRPFSGFVHGGVKAKAREFPHMALLGFGDWENVEWKCGGTLISDEFILTAAHCLVSLDSGTVKHVRVGDLDTGTNQDDAQPQNFDVKAIHQHPDYKPPSFYNDIALIQLDRLAEFTNYVRPACLQTRFRLPDDTTPVATGWGRLSYTGDTSENLMKVSLSYYDSEQCKQAYVNIKKRRLPNGIDRMTQLCAGGFNEEKDTCQGDSGGPLQIKYRMNATLHYVVGITSFGKGCGVKNTPSVYTRVSYYVPWIEDIVWPEVTESKL